MVWLDLEHLGGHWHWKGSGPAPQIAQLAVLFVGTGESLVFNPDTCFQLSAISG